MKILARVTGIKRLLNSRTVLVVNLLVLFFLFFTFGREFVNNYSIQQEIANLEAEKSSLEAQNLEISALMNSVQTETYIEHEARIKLGLSKPGEKVVVVPDTGETSTEVDKNSGDFDYAAEVPITNFSSVAKPLKWWYYFFDINKFQMIKIYGNKSS